MTEMTRAQNENRKSGDFIGDLGDAVRENPVSAALIGMGVLWLFTGGSKTSLFGHANSLLGTLGQGAKKAAGAAYDGAERLGSAVASGVSGAADVVSEAGSRAGDATRAAAAAVGGMLSTTGTQAAAEISSTYEKTAEAAVHGMDEVAHSTKSISRTAQDMGSAWSNNLQRGLADAFDRQPLLLGAVGLAIGAGIAAAVPATDMENKLVGEASDSVKDRAQEFLSTKAQEAKTMASKALKESEAEGLTPKAAGEALRGVADKVAKVVEKAKASAGEQLDKAKQGLAGDRQDKGKKRAPGFPTQNT
jgi:hypothetical protein